MCIDTAFYLHGLSFMLGSAHEHSESTDKLPASTQRRHQHGNLLV